MLRKISHSRDNSVEKGHKRKSSLGNNPPVSGHTYGGQTHKRTTSKSSVSSVNSNFLAEQYDRDRTGLINSCFQKIDPKTGTPVSSYITHVRIIEDARFPSSRPAINSPLENKKKRILIISSQSNGKGMQLHKARENSNGTFQIGRTWDLQELESIERDLEIVQGFLVVMGKKYYWETNSAKERTVFIKSLVSIFMENSGGRVPRLINWDLSMFYLDDASYQRAVVKKRSSQVATPAPKLSPAGLISSPQKEKSIINSREPAISSTSLNSVSPVKTEARTPSPKKASISSLPYSQSSMINEAEKQLNPNNFKRQEMKPATVVALSGSPTQKTESISHSEPQPQIRAETQVPTPPADSDFDTRTKNVIQEIDDMLHSPLKTVDIRHRRSSYHDIEELLENDTQEEEDFDLQLDNDDEFHEASASTLPEQPGDLSFERGDEIRYSQDLNDFNEAPLDTDTNYHLVQTIPEEQSELVDTSRGDIISPDIVNDEPRPESPAPNLEEAINEEVLLEVLTEVNWDVNDNSSSLLEKLHSRLADVDYQFNKNLLSLPNSLRELNPYKDQIFKECDKLDPTLSFFTMELSSVSDDVEFVESQENGLQVRVANKKLLWKQLDEILHSVSVDEQSLRELLRLPISKTSIERIDNLLVGLYAALKAIDGNKDEFINESQENLSSMRALSERIHAYEKVTGLFVERIVQQLTLKFREIEKSTENTKDALSNALIFGSLTLFCKEISPASYEELIDSWNETIYGLYERKTNNLMARIRPVAVNQSSQQFQLISNQSELDALYNWWYSKKIKKNSTQESLDLNPQFSSMIQSIQEIESVCIIYQNFVSDFFHISSRVTFSDYVKNVSLNSRTSTLLQQVEPMESVRKNAGTKNQLVSQIMQTQLTKFFNNIYGIAANNRTETPALLLYLESRIKSLEFSDQEVLRNHLVKFYNRLEQDWNAYIDDQCVYIERAIINFKTRSLSPSVIGFPIFTWSTEVNLKATAKWLGINDYQVFDSKKCFEKACCKLGESTVKLLVSCAHHEMNSDMIDTVDSAEKLDETVTILINANLLLETIPLFDMDDSSAIIQETKKLFDAEKEAYSEMLLNTSMRNLVAFVHGASSLVSTSTEGRLVDPKQWAAYSEQNLTKILSNYTSQEMSTLIARLHENMENHFLNEGDLEGRKVLCHKLWSNIQGKTVSFYLMLYSLIEKHYKGTVIRFTKNDIITAFDKHK